ncbi:hypothetical protein L226DRAFT_545076 [Lentinus tigrinus ALCF2SS1-7]|uniref:Uncharacterized protein n=1 Tax=Lentinus tigrinus ALCF2SS1-6 TaxID=1328759 RepID=A0A5C2SA48_9APHY|nr:hypothetical protein L227DRAFT_593307 [Lentinus tigrinus ALCF2SS1-6]RPD75802.1 hypothetical protein L226DRAFT_545076 [Lentinus tigrinus ALCF2SS1-7]
MEAVPVIPAREQGANTVSTGEILRGTLAEWCAEKGVGEEETLEIEYFESVMPPQRMSTLPHEDWVSPVYCHLSGASQDLTARIIRIELAPNTNSQTLASSGSHLLTSSWDGLIGLLDTSIPATDEIAQEDGDAPRLKRKAPAAVLKSHTARISRVVYGPEAKGATAYSCRFESTVRIWDPENDMCTSTITASSKPFLDIALSQDGQTALALSTDRTVSQYDLRASTSSTTTPSIATLRTPRRPPASPERQLMTEAYDGVSAVAAFRPWEGTGMGTKKVLSVDWARGLVAVGGESGVEVWKVGEGDRVTSG